MQEEALFALNILCNSIIYQCLFAVKIVNDAAYCLFAPRIQMS